MSLRYPLCEGGIAPPLRMLSKGETLRKRGRGYRTQLAMLRSRTPRCGSGPKCRLEGPSPPPPCALGPLPHARLGRPLPEHCKKRQAGWGEQGEGGRGGKGCSLREGSASATGGGGGGPSKQHLGPDPHRGAHDETPKTQKNPRVRKIRVRNSGAGNGCANFMDAWKKSVRSAGKTMSIKFLVLGGGGVFWVGGGGEVPILFLWARGFF